jgi:hypothetical protein
MVDRRCMWHFLYGCAGRLTAQCVISAPEMVRGEVS